MTTRQTADKINRSTTNKTQTHKEAKAQRRKHAYEELGYVYRQHRQHRQHRQPFLEYPDSRKEVQSQPWVTPKQRRCDRTLTCPDCGLQTSAGALHQFIADNTCIGRPDTKEAADARQRIVTNKITAIIKQERDKKKRNLKHKPNQTNTRRKHQHHHRRS